jgi:hypothetical protein
VIIGGNEIMCRVMKLALFVLILVPQISSAEDNIKKFAERYMEAQKNAWENGDFKGLEALEDPDVALQNINGSVTVGLENHKKFIQERRKSLGEIHQEWEYLMGEGNMFCLSYKWTIKSPYNTFIINGLMVGRIRNGKLIEEWGAGSRVLASSD